MIGYCVLYAKNPENDFARRYHSVEHKILNYSTDEIEKDDNYTISADLDEVAEKIRDSSS